MPLLSFFYPILRNKLTMEGSISTRLAEDFLPKDSDVFIFALQSLYTQYTL